MYRCLRLILFASFPFLLGAQEKPSGDSAGTSLYRLRNAEKHRHFYIENEQKPSRRIRLPERSVILMVDETGNYPGTLSRLNAAECFIDSLSGDSLLIRLITEEIDVEQKNMYSNITNNYYAGNFATSYRKIKIADIRYLSMKSPFRIRMSRIGSVVMSLSILTIVAAPFAGMGAEGDEKALRRGNVFMAGISGFVVSIPFFVLGKNKKYGFEPVYVTSPKNQWRLRSLK